ncbi:MAG: hypothetical protein R3B09_00095 [Nannocystaceae bacterium]
MPQSYLLIGRGGGGMSVEISYWSAKGKGWSMHVKFTRATHSGSAGTLRPGECAWADRPLNPDEPAELYLPSGTHWRLERIHHGATNKKVTRIEFEGDHAQQARDLYTWVTTEDHPFYVHCYNGGPSMVITKLGP